MKKLYFILLFVLLSVCVHCEERGYVTSTITDWYVTYPDGTKRVINYWTTGDRGYSTSYEEDDEDLIESIKSVRTTIFNIAPKSTKVDSVYVNFNEVECRYDCFDTFRASSNSRLSRVYDVDSNGNVTLRRKH